MRRSDLVYLLREAGLILVLSYALLLGGTYTGLIQWRLRVASLALLLAVGVAWLGWRWRARPRQSAAGGETSPRSPARWLAGGEPLRGPLLGLLAILLLATLASTDPRRSLIGLWQAGLAVWVFWLVCDLVAAGWPAELWVKALLVVGTVVLGLAILTVAVWYARWLAIGGLARPAPPVLLRLWSLPGNPNYLAATVNLLWPLALARLAARRGRLARLGLAVWVAGAWLVLYFTASRAGWLGAVVSLGALAALWTAERGGLDWLRKSARRLARRRAALVLSLGLLLLVAGAAPLVWQQFSHYSHRPVLEARQRWWGPAWQAFRSDPWLGSGPLTFASAFLEGESIPPGSIFTHAHNVGLHLLAESGLLGLLALVAASALFGRQLLRTWRQSNPAQRVELTGAVAALAGAAAHGLFDTVQMMPALALLPAILGAIGLRPVSSTGRRGWAAPLLWGALAVSGAWSLWAYQPAANGALAGNLADWEAAATAYEEAIDRDPGLALNHFQAGTARGMLAAQDVSQLGSAIDHYRQGLAREPDYAPNHANLAALLWAAGDRQAAIREMALAEARAPRAALFSLNLAVYHETMGDEAAAAAAYRRALESAKWAQEPAFFWRASPLRAAAYRGWAADQVAASDGWTALEQGDLALARERFQTAQAAGPGSADPYRGLAAVAWREGDLARADYWLQVALFVQDQPDARMDWARLAAAQGEARLAVQRAMPVLSSLGVTSAWGPGGGRAADYGWYVFERDAFLSDLLPQVVTPSLSDKMVAWQLETAGWLMETGEADLAGSLCREALKASPDSAGAQRCLDGLAE